MAPTVLIRPLLLMTVLTVSWAATVPLLDAPENDLSEELGAFLEQNPSIARDIYPNLLNAASTVSLTVNQDDVLELIENYVRDATVQEVEEELEREEEAELGEEYSRKKRQTSVEGAISSSRNPFGRSIGGSATVTHSWEDGRHGLSGNVGARRDMIRGKDSSSSYSLGGAYTFRPSKHTSFSIGANKNFSPNGDSSNIGLSFEHRFRR